MLTTVWTDLIDTIAGGFPLEVSYKALAMVLIRWIYAGPPVSTPPTFSFSHVEVISASVASDSLMIDTALNVCGTPSKEGQNQDTDP